MTGFESLLIALAVSSVGSVALAATLFLLPEKRLWTLSQFLLYVAGGTLLGAVFLGMLPKAISLSSVNTVLQTTLIGLIAFFIIEKFVLWRHCGKDCDRSLQAAAPIVLVGDAFHNAIDGIIIAASFLTSKELGWFITLSVVMHEAPQELGDFGILIRHGFTRKKALFYNLLSSSTTLITGIAAYYMLETLQRWIPHTLAISAASFLYIALADLIPEMHRKTTPKATLQQLIGLFIGLLIMYVTIHIHQ